MSALRAFASSDAAVQKTNDDAQTSKASCVRCGYFEDDFLQYFVKRSTEKRAPLINRGYFARVAALKRLLLEFLNISDSRKQIISLGAGFDTTYFHLQDSFQCIFESSAEASLAPSQLLQNPSASKQEVAKYVEIDFVEITRKKAKIISQHRQLQDAIPGYSEAVLNLETGKILASSYELLPGDLRETEQAIALLEEAGLDWTAPTFIIAECVLVYMPADSSQQLVSRLGGLLTSAAFIIYEQILPDDAFGQQMMTNIERRGCPLLGIYGTPDLVSQCSRFTNHGWDAAWALDMDDIYKYLVPLQERRRIERLELFDELEEWHLIQKHYCIVVGSKDPRAVLPDGLKESPRR